MKKMFLFILFFSFIKAMEFDPTSCKGSCEAQLTSKITTGWCLCCCSLVAGNITPSEKAPLIKRSILSLNPEKEFALGVIPWLIAGVPCTYLGSKGDGHSCCWNNIKIVGKWSIDNFLDFYRELMNEAHNYFCPPIKDFEKED